MLPCTMAIGDMERVQRRPFDRQGNIFKAKLRSTSCGIISFILGEIYWDPMVLYIRWHSS